MRSRKSLSVFTPFRAAFWIWLSVTDLHRQTDIANSLGKNKIRIILSRTFIIDISDSIYRVDQKKSC